MNFENLVRNQYRLFLYKSEFEHLGFVYSPNDTTKLHKNCSGSIIEKQINMPNITNCF